MTATVAVADTAETRIWPAPPDVAWKYPQSPEQKAAAEAEEASEPAYVKWIAPTPASVAPPAPTVVA